MTTLGGKKLATCSTMDRRYFDPAKKGYYFRFASGTTSPSVSAGDVELWGWPTLVKKHAK